MAKMRRRLVFLLIMAVILAINAYQTFPENEFDGLVVTFIDVGQGDAILLQTAQGDNILIDSGEKKNFDSKLGPTLENCGVERLDALVATHYHSDHIGGMQDIFKRFEVGTLVIPDYEPDNDAKARLLAQARREAAKVFEAAEGDAVPCLDANLNISILHPQVGGFSDDENSNSLVLKAEYLGTTLLLTGDLEEEGELALIDKYDVETDILKVGHHGSSSSTSAKFLAEADPTYAVIQCGVDNSYGHPHNEVLERLWDDDVLIYRTDEDKSITFNINEKGVVKVKTNRN